MVYRTAETDTQTLFIFEGQGCPPKLPGISPGSRIAYFRTKSVSGCSTDSAPENVLYAIDSDHNNPSEMIKTAKAWGMISLDGNGHVHIVDDCNKPDPRFVRVDQSDGATINISWNHHDPNIDRAFWFELYGDDIEAMFESRH